MPRVGTRMVPLYNLWRVVARMLAARAIGRRRGGRMIIRPYKNDKRLYCPRMFNLCIKRPRYRFSGWLRGRDLIGGVPLVPHLASSV